MYHPPNHKQRSDPVKPLTLADALLRTELEGTRAKWYQDYLASKQRYEAEATKDKE